MKTELKVSLIEYNQPEKDYIRGSKVMLFRS